MVDFCTLFDSNYIDRGLALYRSLENVIDSFCLYIFCFDEKAFNILSEMSLKNAVLIREADILDEQLNKVKTERRRTEYCWTCTPAIIEYVLKNYSVPDCTYIDADMFFYGNPEPIIEDLRRKNVSASLIGHRFPDTIARIRSESLYGRYCVEFNTFSNTEAGRKIVSWWKKKCIESCTMELYEEGYGDQKYLGRWKEQFPDVFEVENIGAGVAPWNVSDYRLDKKEKDGTILLKYRKKEVCQLVFYHFQNVKILSDKEADIGVYNELGIMDNVLISFLYQGYIRNLMEIRKEIKRRFGFEIPMQEIRKGESKDKLCGVRDWLVYIWQSLIIIARGHKNRINICEEKI